MAKFNDFPIKLETSIFTNNESRKIFRRSIKFSKVHRFQHIWGPLPPLAPSGYVSPDWMVGKYFRIYLSVHLFMEMVQISRDINNR